MNNTETISMIKIIIPCSFKATLPNPHKIYNCYKYYRSFQKFDRDIVLDKDNYLTDGYVAYLVAKMLGIRKVPIVRERGD